MSCSSLIGSSAANYEKREESLQKSMKKQE